MARRERDRKREREGESPYLVLDWPSPRADSTLRRILAESLGLADSVRSDLRNREKTFEVGRMVYRSLCRCLPNATGKWRSGRERGYENLRWCGRVRKHAAACMRTYDVAATSLRFRWRFRVRKLNMGEMRRRTSSKNPPETF